MYLSAEKCIRSLSLRGVVRIWCAQEIPHVLRFLTHYGYVNTGFITNVPRPFPLASGVRTCSVLVVGAGTAGLAAAYHLRNFGYKVVLLLPLRDCITTFFSCRSRSWRLVVVLGGG